MENRKVGTVVTRMDTVKSGWTPYVYKTKPKKAEWTEPKIKSPKKEKNSTYLAPLWIITWAD